MMDQFEEDNLEREEAKEEEYDYFLDPQSDENANDAQGYHIIDENQQCDSDEEELDEEEKRERHNNMLKELKDKI